MASAVVDFAKLVPEGTVIRAVSDGYGGAIFVTDRYVDVEFEVVDDETDAKKPLAVKPAAVESDAIVALKA